MRKIKSELRLYIAEKLLRLAWHVAPKNKEGHQLQIKVLTYFLTKINNKKGRKGLGKDGSRLGGQREI